MFQVISAYMMIQALNKKGYNPFAISIPSPNEFLQIFAIAAPVFVSMFSKVDYNLPDSTIASAQAQCSYSIRVFDVSGGFLLSHYLLCHSYGHIYGRCSSGWFNPHYFNNLFHCFSFLSPFKKLMTLTTSYSLQVMIQTYGMFVVWGEPLSQTAQSFMPEILYGVNQSLDKVSYGYTYNNSSSEVD